jgi:hypothetical protein
MRQRLLPLTVGDIQVLPERVLAPQRRLANIGPVLRAWSLVIRWPSLYGNCFALDVFDEPHRGPPGIG